MDAFPYFGTGGKLQNADPCDALRRPAVRRSREHGQAGACWGENPVGAALEGTGWAPERVFGVKSASSPTTISRCET